MHRECIHFHLLGLKCLPHTTVDLIFACTFPSRVAMQLRSGRVQLVLAQPDARARPGRVHVDSAAGPDAVGQHGAQRRPHIRLGYGAEHVSVLARVSGVLRKCTCHKPPIHRRSACVHRANLTSFLKQNLKHVCSDTSGCVCTRKRTLKSCTCAVRHVLSVAKVLLELGSLFKKPPNVQNPSNITLTKP